MGRRRKLFGLPDDRAKDGLNHMIQGSVADLADFCIIEISRRWPHSSLILNKHDGMIIAFPNEYPPDTTRTAVQTIVEKDWEVGPGIIMNFPAEWDTIAN